MLLKYNNLQRCISFRYIVIYIYIYIHTHSHTYIYSFSDSFHYTLLLGIEYSFLILGVFVVHLCYI